MLKETMLRISILESIFVKDISKLFMLFMINI